MIGGTHDPEALSLDDEKLLGAVRKDLKTAMGLTTNPILTRIYRYPVGIAQYIAGHQNRAEQIHRRLAHLPGLWVAGGSDGSSMNNAIENADTLARRILMY